MPKPEPDHSTAHIARTLQDGTIEEVMGGVEKDEHGNWRIILNGDFSDKPADIADMFTGPSEVETYPLLHVRSEHGWFTAVSSRVISRRRNFGGTKLSRIVLRPRYFIEGQARLSANELSLTQATVRFDAQPDWTEQESWALGKDFKTFERIERENLMASSMPSNSNSSMAQDSPLRVRRTPGHSSVRATSGIHSTSL